MTDRLEAIVRGGYNKALSGNNIDRLQLYPALRYPEHCWRIAERLYHARAARDDLYGNLATPQTLAAVSSALTDLNDKYVNPKSYRKHYGSAPGARTTQASTSPTSNYELGDHTTLKSIQALSTLHFLG